MNAKEIKKRLDAATPRLKDLHIRSLKLFGSTVRGHVGPDSDIDLFVTFERPVGLFHFSDAQDCLSEILAGEKVDLVSENALTGEIKREVEEEAIPLVGPDQME